MVTLYLVERGPWLQQVDRLYHHQWRHSISVRPGAGVPGLVVLFHTAVLYTSTRFINPAAILEQTRTPPWTSIKARQM